MQIVGCQVREIQTEENSGAELSEEAKYLKGKFLGRWAEPSDVESRLELHTISHICRRQCLWSRFQ